MTEDQRYGLQYWVEKMNARGHAGTFGRGRSDQGIIEASVLQEWVRSISQEWGIEAKEPRLLKDDPPDAEAAIDEKTVTIELKEFVDPELLKKSTHAKKHSEPYSVYGGEGFRESQWTEKKFKEQIATRVSTYAKKYSSSNKPVFDFLLLYTDEPWLSPSDVEQWTKNGFLEEQTQFRRVHFMMTYSPGYRPYWPIFEIK